MGDHSMKQGFRDILVSDPRKGKPFFYSYVRMGPTKDLVVRMRIPYSSEEKGYRYGPVLSGCFLDAPEWVVEGLCNYILWGVEPD